MKHVYYYSTEIPGLDQQVFKVDVIKRINVDGIDALLGHFDASGSAISIFAVIITSSMREYSLHDLLENEVAVLPVYLFDAQIYPNSQEELVNKGVLDKGLLAVQRHELVEYFGSE